MAKLSCVQFASVTEHCLTTCVNLSFTDAQFGKTPLMYAAEGRKTDVVKELVRRGADVNAQDKVRWRGYL